MILDWYFFSTTSAKHICVLDNFFLQSITHLADIGCDFDLRFFPFAEVKLVCSLILPGLFGGGGRLVGGGLVEGRRFGGGARRSDDSPGGGVESLGGGDRHHGGLDRGDLRGLDLERTLRLALGREGGLLEAFGGWRGFGGEVGRWGRRERGHFVTPGFSLPEPGGDQLLGVRPELRVDVHRAQDNDEDDDAHR
jgi:hypothetical protein